jgi:hypothetical protein
MFGKFETIVASAVAALLALATSNFGSLGQTKPSTIAAPINPEGIVEVGNQNDCPPQAPTNFQNN